MMNLIDSHDTFRFLESAQGNIDKLKITTLFQMTYVGTPHIWYGDEVGMMGKHDPDCRRPFNWKYNNDKEKVALRDYYKKLIQIRKDNIALRRGSFQTLLTKGMIYGFLREYKGEKIIVIINNENKTKTVTLDTGLGMRSVNNLLTNKQYPLKNGNILEIELAPQTGAILK
jgi:glycosidase